MAESKNSARTGPAPVHCVISDAASDVLTPPHDPAQYRSCEVCREPGADVATRIFVADSGASHTSYAHRDCAEANEPTGVITP